MKKWIGTFWRVNPQFEKGGYMTTRTVEARTQASARNKLIKQYVNCRHAYGSMELILVKEA